MSEVKGKVLIVDDEPDIVEIVSLFVESFGYEFVSANSGNDGFAKFQEDPGINVIISDVMMANGSGVDLITKIRGSGSQVPVIFLTAYASKEYTLEGLRMGVFELIDKPFEADNIKKVLDSAMRARIESETIQQIAGDLSRNGEGEDISKLVDGFTSEYKNQLLFCKGAVTGLNDSSNKSHEMSYILRVLQTGESEAKKYGLGGYAKLLTDSVSYLSCCRMELELVGVDEISFIGKIVDTVLFINENVNADKDSAPEAAFIRELESFTKEFESNIID